MWRITGRYSKSRNESKAAICMKRSRLIPIARSIKVTRGLDEAASDMSPVTGLTHNFYRYPARLSPIFVRAAIEAFSKPGDLVLDPFMGGGTTLVEAMALGRDAVGIDISELAAFVSEVKTTVFSDDDLKKFRLWVKRAECRIDMQGQAPIFKSYNEAGYHRNLQSNSTWRLRKAIAQVLGPVERLHSKKLQQLARCVTLRTAQWALDGRRKLPSVEEFRASFVASAAEVLQGAETFRNAVQSLKTRRKPSVRCFTRATAGIERDPFFQNIRHPRLVLMSPPYPGIHVLYHRWQVEGGKEIPAPFWIANKLDGSGESFYMMGNRRQQSLDGYFGNLRESLTSIASLCSSETTIVQVVAFAQPSWQLPRYLAVAEEAGLEERFLPNSSAKSDGRLWRAVPNRKWYADQKGMTHGSQEVVLFHRKASA
jgi:hypothetical protein